MSRKQRRVAGKPRQPAAMPASAAAQLPSQPQLPFQMFEEAVRYHQAGLPVQAEALYRAVLTIQPSHVQAWYNLGVLMQTMGRSDRAVPLYQEALKLQPQDVSVLSNLATALKDLRQTEEAIAIYRQALAIKPDDVLALSNLGVALKDAGRFEEALRTLEQARRLNPGDPKLLTNLGAARFDCNDLDGASAAYAEALELAPDFAMARVNMGSALRNQGRIADAMAEYRRAIQTEPNFAEAHYCLGQLLLLLGDYEQGWQEYGWRWKLKEYSWLRNLHGDIQQPLWTGESLAGKTLLIYAEQGLGDTIQIVRYVPAVLARGGSVVLAVHPPLKRLFACVEGVRLIGLDEPLPAFDYHSPLFSLPRVFGTRPDTIPAAVPYLRPPAGESDKWRVRLGGDARPSVGLVWSGNRLHTNDRNRSLGFEGLRPLLDRADVRFYSLQKDPRPADQQALGGLADRIVDLAPELGDFADTAAVLAALDLVVTVDTSVAHLAGALGRPVWIMLPFVPDWRWLQDREDTPWYPTARLFRQQSRDDWRGVIEQVAAALPRFAAEQRPAAATALAGS